MTWTSYHRRGDVLRAVIAAAENRRDGVLPTDVAGVAGPGAVFRDELDLLGALQISWHTRLMGRLDRRLTHQPASLEDSVIGAWHEAYAELGGVRAVLDRARESESEVIRPAMARATAKEQLTLALAAGRGSSHDGAAVAASVRAGARIEQRARDTFTPARAAEATSTTTEVAPRVWGRMIDRLRSLAA